MNHHPMESESGHILSLVPIHSVRTAELRPLVALEPPHSADGVPRPSSPEATTSWLMEARLGWVESLAYTFGIHVSGVGLVGVTRLGMTGEASGVLSYWVADPHRGQGYASRAAQRTLAFAWEQLGLRRVNVLAAEDNEASQRLAQRLGFRRVGPGAPARGQEPA